LTESTTARIQWIKLGSTNSKTIEDLVNVRGIKPENIMESLTTDPNDASYTQIVLAKKKLWVKLKAANNGFTDAEIQLAAAFLETHR
ncbi:alkaline phosphatase, partial [Acinetobacter schindleri]